jgi:enterochelin esterase-like enzyme
VGFERGRIPKSTLSIASMPKAPREQWIIAHPNVPKGKVEAYLLKSHILGSDRKIWVYTPAGYDAKKPDGYPLLVLFDGFGYQHWISAPTILDNLIYARKIPRIVMVLIDNPPETRSADLEYNLAFVRWLGDALLPWLHANLNLSYDPRKAIIGGYSEGGAAAAFAAMQRPGLFGNVFSQSGSFWEGHRQTRWQYLASLYREKAKLPLRFFIEAGTLENISKDGPSLLAANRQLAEILKSKGYQVTYQEVGGTHEPVHWRDTLPQGLLVLLK